MSRLSLRKAPLGAAIAAAVIVSGAAASTAAAGNTNFKVVGNKLFITASSGDANNINLEYYSATAFRLKDTGVGVTLVPGAGIGSTASYSSQDIAFNTYASIDSVRIKTLDGNDVVNIVLTPLPSQVFAGPGADTLTAGLAPALLSGGTGNDNLNGGGKDDVLIGGSGDDKLWGNAGDDAFFTVDNNGYDELNGGAGDDQSVVDSDYIVSGIESAIIGD